MLNFVMILTFNSMKSQFTLTVILLSLLTGISSYAQVPDRFKKLNTAIDNQGYWRKAAELGLTRLNPMNSAPPAVYTGSGIRAVSVITEDSPDVVIITGNTAQSENSVFVNPQDANNPLNSNNSSTQPGGGMTFYGSDYLYSFDEGLTWQGSVQGAGGTNQGDPTTAIGLNGRYYIGYINNGMGQGVSYSDNQGATWTPVTVSSGGGNTLDKNHMWIDNSPTSPYEGTLYDAWTPFGGPNDSEIELSRSTNDGQSWSTPVKISAGANAGYLCQGVNINTGPNGEVYAVFCIYDNWPSDEDAIGMARSFDGGQTWESFRIITNIRGIRSTGTGKNMRVNAFPVMTCDISSGPNRGNIYVTWTNVGVPGVNTGYDVDVYMIRSEDNGDTWSEPVRVNQDPQGAGKKHYFGWITCDPATGTLSMIFYDDRNVSSSQVEVFCANSIDAGDTWEDFKVSDVAFSPSPLPGYASQYFGDYLGISARNGKVYPVWTDNRSGTALAYTSPYVTSTMMPPTALNAQLNDETGQVNLTWTHEAGPTFDHYNIYRGFSLIGTTVLPIYSDMLPGYGSYRYQVTAVYIIEGESAPAIADVQWGDAQAETDPASIEVFVLPESTSSFIMDLANTGELPLEYTSTFSLPGNAREAGLAYCTGIGGCGGEGIAGVVYGDVSNFSECNSYSDYSDLSHMVSLGDSFDITVQNITNMYSEDVCGIWVDWNGNESFLDDGAITVSGSPGPGPYTATITVPDNAANGEVRMRIRIRRGGTLSPCGSAPNGEVEDYSLNVLGWVTANPREGEIDAGETQPVTFDFNSAGLALGTYLAHFTIISNDPDNGELVVPVTMHVDNAAVTITSDKDSLCLGSSTTLHANITGGSGNFTYSWTSDPAGFVSDDPDPVIEPTVTTTYFVEATDGNIILSDQITITVLAIPDLNLGNDLFACVNDEVVLDAGAGFQQYFWSTGETAQSITVTDPGSYWVTVLNENECAATDTVNVIFNPLPEISLGPDQQFCQGTTVMLSAGTGFQSYLWNTGASSYYINAGEPGEYWVEVTDDNGCRNRDTITLAVLPLPEVDLGEDRIFCEGTTVLLTPGSGYEGYLWSNGATSASIDAGLPGDYWVEITDETGCKNTDTVTLIMDPLPLAPQITSGPQSVDLYVILVSDYTLAESAYADSYEWNISPAAAGSVDGNGTTARVTWNTGFTGTADITAKGVNDCGNGNDSQVYSVSVYSSQGIGESGAISSVKLFPNPNEGNFVLEMNSKEEQELIFSVASAGGNKVLETGEKLGKGVIKKSFNLSAQPAGTYYITISDKENKILGRLQVVIK